MSNQIEELSRKFEMAQRGKNHSQRMLRPKKNILNSKHHDCCWSDSFGQHGLKSYMYDIDLNFPKYS